VVGSWLATRMQQALAVVVAFSALGCASIGSQYAATPVDAEGRLMAARTMPSGLAISGEELRAYASAYFGMVEITFENKTAEWVHIDRVSLDFGGGAKNEAVVLPDGPDLDAWYEATLQRNDIRETNAATALGALFAVGQAALVVGALSGKREVAAAGGALALGTATAALVDGQDRRVQRAQGVRVTPRSHLLNVPFAVPPGLFTKKWVLLQTRSRAAPCINTMLIDYDTRERGRERALLTFRTAFERSEWQRGTCSSPAWPK
jgi:hypothetical protein